MTADVCAANPRIDSDIQLLTRPASKDDVLISERLATLARSED